MELKYPAFLLPCGLVFWGWQSEMMLASSIILVLVAFSKHTPWRWEMGIAEFHRVADLTTVLFGFAIAYFYSADSETLPIYALLRWLPVLSCPLLFGQIYSTGQLLPLSALFYSMRRYVKPGNQPRRVDMRLPYAFLCILAAGSSNATDQSYYLGITAFTLWVLWPSRPKRQPNSVWLLGASLAVMLGHGLQTGLVQMQSLIEEWAVDWFSTWEPDPFKARTSIGDRGSLKLSSRVLLKVSTSTPLNHPLLLKEAVYDRYSGRLWSVGNAIFQPYTPPHADGSNQITVLHLLAKHSVLLTLPDEVRGLDGPPEKDLLHNPLDTVKWMDTPPVVRYRIAYDPSGKDGSAPTPHDSQLPQSTREMLEPLVLELNLRHLPPETAIATINKFFAVRFAYSLNLGDQSDGDKALKDFLYHRHSGHCEYFATATALLLRAATIPSRYVVGYSVQEYDPAGKTYLVRKRHAHAWAEAYVDGAWHTVDNTPSRWAEEEAKADPWWQPLVDVWSGWAMAIKIWQWERAQHPKQGIPWWAWLVLPLSVWLGLRLYRSRKRVSATPVVDPQSHNPDQSADPAYCRLEQQILAAGHPPRNPGETPLRWLRRLGLNVYESEVLAYYRRRYGGER